MAVNIKKGRAGHIDFTPMLDMVFNLLIFFMVASHFSEVDRELDAQLATASEARPITATVDSVFININQAGQYFADGRIMALDDLEAFLRQKHVNNPGSLSVKIRPDVRGTLQPSISALNACAKVGIRDVSFATDGNP
jgi:biopolymer transport protein ExbD